MLIQNWMGTKMETLDWVLSGPSGGSKVISRPGLQQQSIEVLNSGFRLNRWSEALSQDQRGEPLLVLLPSCSETRTCYCHRASSVAARLLSVRTLTVDFLDFSNVSERALMKRYKTLAYVTYRWPEWELCLFLSCPLFCYHVIVKGLMDMRLYIRTFWNLTHLHGK